MSNTLQGDSKSERIHKVPATKFKAELWTTASSREVWSVVMLDGDEAGFPCAFGPKEKMEQYAEQLNTSKGVLSPVPTEC